jgi:hypothetical protein
MKHAGSKMQNSLMSEQLLHVVIVLQKLRNPHLSVSFLVPQFTVIDIAHNGRLTH